MKLNLAKNKLSLMAAALLFVSSTTLSYGTGRNFVPGIGYERNTSLLSRTMYGIYPNGQNYTYQQQGSAFAEFSPLYTAIKSGNIQQVETILNSDPSLLEKEQTPPGSPPLRIAACFNQSAVLKFLLDKGANINECSEGNSTVLHIACLKVSIDCINLLLARGADLNATDKFGNTPLHILSSELNMNVSGKDPKKIIDTVILLIRHGANKNLKNLILKQTPFDTCNYKAQLETAYLNRHWDARKSLMMFLYGVGIRTLQSRISTAEIYDTKTLIFERTIKSTEYQEDEDKRNLDLSFLFSSMVKNSTMLR